MQIIYKENRFFQNRFFHERNINIVKIFSRNFANKEYLFRFLRFYLFVLFGWKENLYYEVNPCHLSLLRKEIEEKGEKADERFTRLQTVKIHLPSWKRNFHSRDTFLFPCTNSLSSSLSFSLLLSFSSSFFIFYKNQPFHPVSLILFFCPGKTCIYPRIACLTVSSPLSVHWSSHFSFVAWRKVHFSRVTCRQRYKGIFRASANITQPGQWNISCGTMSACHCSWIRVCILSKHVGRSIHPYRSAHGETGCR